MLLTPQEIDAHLKRWRPLVIGIARKFQGRARLGATHGFDDIVAIGMAALWDAARNFDSENEAGASFCTYANHVVRNAYRSELKSLGTSKRSVARETCNLIDATYENGAYIFEPEDESKDPEEVLALKRAKIVLDKAVRGLPVSNQRVIRLVYERGLGSQEIGERFGYSRQAAAEHERRGLAKLRIALGELDL